MKNQKGTTLIEVMICAVIVVILYCWFTGGDPKPKEGVQPIQKHVVTECKEK